MAKVDLSDVVNRLERQLVALDSEHTRTRRGVERANRVGAELDRRVSLVERLGGVVETLSDQFSGVRDRLRTHDEELASHEGRISALEAQSQNEQRGIFGIWLITLGIVEVTILTGYLLMKSWKNGSGVELGSLPHYDGLFGWVAAGSAVVITLVAMLLSVFERPTQQPHEQLAATTVAATPTEVLERVEA